MKLRSNIKMSREDLALHQFARRIDPVPINNRWWWWAGWIIAGELAVVAYFL